MSSAARQYRQVQEQQRNQRDFKVLSGSGKQQNKHLSLGAQNFLKICCAVVLFVFALGVVRIAFTAQTVSVLLSNNTLTNEITNAQARGDDLQVQQSIFANPGRVERIARDNLGMVSAEKVADLDISQGYKTIPAASQNKLSSAEKSSEVKTTEG